MIHVKICGIRRLEDALAALDYGADELGFLVGQKHASPDFLDEAVAARLVDALPPSASSVLVTHLVEPDDIVALATTIGVTTSSCMAIPHRPRQGCSNSSCHISRPTRQSTS